MRLTIQDIRDIEPCYDPTEYLPEDWSGTIIDILNVEDCPAIDRLWVVTRFLDDRTNRLFAVWYAREELKLIENPDPRSVEVCNVAERFANGEATDQELNAARDAARDAAWDAEYADRDAAWAAVWAAAYAARDGVRAAARYDQIAHLKTMIEEFETVEQ